MFCFDEAVRYSEIGPDGLMTLPSVLDLLQDCCAFQSEELGIGLSYLNQEHKAWVLSFWQVIVNRYPRLGEQLHICTWPYDFKGFMGYRNFKIETPAGEVIVYANSIWTFMDTKSGHPVRLSDDVRRRYEMDPPYEMDCAGRKIRLPEDMERQESIRAGRSHIDTNRHVNNCKYVMMAEEYLPTDYKVKELRVEYRRAAVLGDTIYPQIKKDGKTFFASLENEADEPYAIIEFMEG